VLTFAVMLVILMTAQEQAAVGKQAALAVGFVVAACGFAAGPISGASMNPARTIAPQLVAGAFGNVWIYIAGPLIGAALAVGATRCSADRLQRERARRRRANSCFAAAQSRLDNYYRLRLGTLAPERRASLKPIAMACLRLLTFLPERPDLSSPLFIPCIARSTFFCAFGPYFRPDFLRELDFLRAGISATPFLQQYNAKRAGLVP
jgi:hypothetical protein